MESTVHPPVMVVIRMSMELPQVPVKAMDTGGGGRNSARHAGVKTIAVYKRCVFSSP